MYSGTGKKMLKCEYCGYEAINVYDFIRHKIEEKNKLIDNFRDILEPYKTDKNKLLQFLYDYKNEGKIKFKYEFSKTCTIIRVIDPKTGIELYSWFFSYGLGWLRGAIYEYWNFKCANCKMSDAECLKKYDRGLEIHHTTPISFYNGEITNKSPLDMFAPLCHECHPRGYQ